MDSAPVHPANGDHLSTLDATIEEAREKFNKSPLGRGLSYFRNGEQHEADTVAQLQAKFENSFQDLKTLVKAMKEPLPVQTGDGTYLPDPEKEKTIANDLKVILSDAATKLPAKDLGALVKIQEDNLLGNPINDRDYLMEYLIQAAAKLPTDDVSGNITNNFIKQLWSDLPHPPQTLLNDQSIYRQPDGSYNNYLIPDLGKSKMPYARTVPPQTMQPGSLPDPAVLFESVMARKNTEGTQHPSKISSMLFYLASIIIHDLFKTDHTDPRISLTSSYLDLAPLYGSTWAEQQAMRTMKDGKIKPDCFSEPRLLSFPPGVGALLICFNRYHNYIVEQLALINEDNRFVNDGKKISRYGTEVEKYDDDLFQTGRLITCGLYVNLILIDYVRTILDLNKTNDNWQLDPRINIPNGPPVGTGNQVSAEFNLVYRWHAATSHKDDVWTQELFSEMFPGKTVDQVTQREFLMKLGQLQSGMESLQPNDRPWPALKEEQASIKRQTDGPYKGSFQDNDIAAILTAGVKDCANAMGPRQVPRVMKEIEVLGIMQARTWKVGTLNELRKHFKLTEHRTFDDITKDKEVADALMRLYDHPDNVELYPGLVVEDAKHEMVPGSGLCPSFTVSRAVLSDAVALVRGDSHYTTLYTPAALTNWGFTEANSDLTIDNGCVFYKLFLRALPNNFQPNSVYAHYPLTIPGEMERVLKGLDLKYGTTNAQKYDYTTPAPIPQPAVIFSYDAAVKIMNDKDRFNVTWGKAMEFLMGPPAENFMLSGDGPKNAKSRKLMENALYEGGSSWEIPKGNEKWLTAVKDYYQDITAKLLQEKTYQLVPGVNQVDIIRDIGNMAHVHFCSELFALPLKTVSFKHGIFSEDQMYLVMAAVFICVFFDVDPPKSFPLRQQARAATQQLGNLVKIQVEAVKATGNWSLELLEAVHPSTGPLRSYGLHMIKRLVDADTDVNDLVWGNIMGTAGGMVANQGQLFGQTLDYFFTDGKEHIEAIQKLAEQDTAEAFDTLMHYFMEGSRLNGETGVFRQVAKDVTGEIAIEDNNSAEPQSYKFKAGDRVMIDLKAASRDSKAFPDPDKVVLTRDLNSYIHLGHGPHQCLGLPMTRVALTTMFKEIFKLKNLRPATVSIGNISGDSKVKKIEKEFIPGDSKVLPASWHYHAFMTEDWDQMFPFPTSKLLPDCFPSRSILISLQV